MAVLNGQSLLFAGGYDISGDAGAISGITGGASLLDVSSINVVGTKRISGRFDASMGYNVYFNPLGAHVLHAAYPTTAVPLLLAVPGTAAGDEAFMLVGKQVAYNPAFGQDLAASFSVDVPASDGFPLEVGNLITAGKRTDTGATASGTGIDLGLPVGVAATVVTSATAASPTEVTATAHGLATGESVVIAGTDQATLNDEWTVTVTSNDTFTVPCDLSVAGAATGGTVQRTSHRGWSAQNQVFSVAGTSVTVTVQDSHEAVSGSFANLSAFSAVSAGNVGAERIGSAAGIIKRYVRVKTTGTFSNAVFATGIYTKEG